MLDDVDRTPKRVKVELSFPARYLPEFENGLRHCVLVDPSLKTLVESHTFARFVINKDTGVWNEVGSFESLVRGIIGQQLSGAAGKSIAKRFVRTCTDSKEFPSPGQVLDTSSAKLKGSGLSARKVEYILGVASQFQQGKLTHEKLQQTRDDQELTDMILSLKGIGPWSASMFLAFNLGRMDVFAFDDLGLKRGIALYLCARPQLQRELDAVEWPPSKTAPRAKASSAKRKWHAPDSRVVNYIANRFRPYRTVFMMILWKISDTQMGILEDRMA